MTILTPTTAAPAASPAVPAAAQRVSATPPAADVAPVTSAQAPTPTIQEQIKAAAPKLEDVQRAIERVKQSIKPPLNNTLEFQIDQASGKTVVKIMDTTTNTLVRQIPSEEALAIADALDRMDGRGGLVKGQA